MDKRQAAADKRPGLPAARPPDCQIMPAMNTRTPSHRGTLAHRRTAGFTLVELAIAIVIIAVLAAIALPSFMDSIRKSRRSEAFTALSALQQAQERWRSNNAMYTTTLSNLGFPSATVGSGYYQVDVQNHTSTPADLATGYVVIAEGKSGTSQANDLQCRKLSVKVSAGTVEYAGCGSCSSFAYAAADPCWAR